MGAYSYKQTTSNAETQTIQSHASKEILPKESSLIREYSPVIGNDEAQVTVVEFFDPSCEACRAFYPIVKNILNRYPKDVRVVLRYAPFHEGSDKA
ncbi:MAG: disulfide bond formation protein DsbA, partial [Micavibrio aeruginosavorus]